MLNNIIVINFESAENLICVKIKSPIVRYPFRLKPIIDENILVVKTMRIFFLNSVPELKSVCRFYSLLLPSVQTMFF